MVEPSAADIVEAQDATQPLAASPTSLPPDSPQSNALTRSSGRDADLSEDDQLLGDAGWTSVKPKKGSRRFSATTGKAAQASGAGRKVFVNTLGSLFDRLPIEVIEAVIGSILPEWQRMPTAFQLSHVCSGWRALVRSMPSLWGDHCSLLPPANITRGATSRRVPQPYHFLPTRTASSRQLAWLRHCAKLSHDPVKHFEMEVWDWQGEEDEVLNIVLAQLEKSLHSLESLNFVTRKTTGTMDALQLQHHDF